MAPTNGRRTGESVGHSPVRISRNRFFDGVELEDVRERDRRSRGIGLAQLMELAACMRAQQAIFNDRAVRLQREAS